MKKFCRILILILCAVLLVHTGKFLYQIGMRVLYPLRYEAEIEQYCEQYSLDRNLVMALIKAESNYIYDAHSGIARGLMQITDETAQWIAEKLEIEFESDDIENPETNIKMGCYYLRYLLNYYSDVEALALSAYNAGMGNVDKWLSDKSISSDGISLDYIPFPETEKYIQKIKKSKEIYKKLYNNKEE